LENVLLIQSADKSRAAMILTNSVSGKSMQKTGKLVFHRYGDKYFLSQVWSPGLQVGRTVPASDIERSLDREMARTVRTIETAKKN
ncbi:MAG TPA: hypothetical protein VLD57_10830, partial [Blastocatellia bacterium]|nr:hypothetical protein [Blastocatellia bacterium]